MILCFLAPSPYPLIAMQSEELACVVKLFTKQREPRWHYEQPIALPQL
jgi:hypothetical protein